MPECWRAWLLSILTLAWPMLGMAQDNPASDSQSWPFLRGPHFDGHAPPVKLAKQWPAEGPPVLWTRSLGAGYSGFTALDQRVFTQYQTLGGQYVVCLEGDTGETVWEYRYEGPHDPAGLYPGPRATPTLGRGHVYFSAPSGLVGCLLAETGKRVWSWNVFEQFGVEPVEFGYSCSPVLVEDTLFVFVGQPDATLVAIQADTGRVLWQSGDEAISHVPPMPITWNGQPLILGYLRNVLLAFDQKTGEERFRKPLSSGYDEHAAWPIYREPYLWISAPFRAGSELLELTETPPGFRTVWKSSLLSNDVCSSVLVGDSLFGFDIRDVQSKVQRPSRGQFRCLDFLTGKERWVNGGINQRRGFQEESNDSLRDGTGNLPVGQASVLHAEDTLILFNDTGELILAKADADQYVEQNRVRVLGGELCWTQPTLTRGRLYVRNHSRAVCLVLSDPKSGEHPVTGPTLRIEDIPQSTYRDWAAWLLPIEPEYAMDAPTIPQLKRWFLVTVIGFGAAALLTSFCLLTHWAVSGRKVFPSVPTSASAEFTPAAKRINRPARLRWLLSLLWFALGALGTTFLSLHYDEFLFTWPVCLFVLFQAVVYQTRTRKGQAGNAWIEWFWLLAFGLACLAYYFLCRRLSLAFEWMFLAGFPAAVPLLLLARRQAAARHWPIVREWVCLLAGYGCFYWLSAGLLIWKYHLTT